MHWIKYLKTIYEYDEVADLMHDPSFLLIWMQSLAPKKLKACRQSNSNNVSPIVVKNTILPPAVSKPAKPSEMVDEY